MFDQWNEQNTPEQTSVPTPESDAPPVQDTVPVTPAETTPVPTPVEASYVPHVSPAYDTSFYVPGNAHPEPEAQRHTTSVWMAVLAIIGAIAIVAGIGAGIYFAIMSGTNSNEAGISQQGEEKQPTVIQTPSANDTSNNSDSGAVNENAPTLQIDTWDTDDGGLSTEEIVNRNYDSTVVITTYSRTNSYYFGESNLVESGGASGIVMTADGYIITNRHCVVNENTGKPFDRVDVTTYKGDTYENATIVGVDEATDLAVIKVEATGLTPAQFGDSDELAVGARVVALGNAAGLSWTATQGIVSAKARDVYDDTGYAIKCLQVDVAINSGNSGGPLLNKQGLVVGINSVKIFATGYEGLGFAIPINEAKQVIDSLMKYGYVKGRVALGITGQTVDSGIYKGFMIGTIEPGSCLEGTGALEGDLIVEVGGATVIDYGTLRAQLAKHQVGDQVTLKLLRSDPRTGQVTSHSVVVTLKEQTAQ